jgi:predicted O-linked N-acetylglucosamine transferase (SPINDLY family)
MSYIDILVHKSVALQEHGHLEEALTILEDALSVEPNHVGALKQLGSVRSSRNDHAGAISCLEKILDLVPESLDVLFGLGVEFHYIGRHDDALHQFEKLLYSQPTIPALHRWRGVSLSELGRDNEALLEYLEALRLLPEYSEALISLASLLMKQCRFDEAIGYLYRAIEINPDSGPAYNDLSRIYRLQGKNEEARYNSRKSFELMPGNRQAADCMLYLLCYADNVAPEEAIAEHIRIASKVYAPPSSIKVHRNLHTKKTNARLNIGYLSGDFFTHSVAFFLEPILIHHDRNNFSIFCYSNRNNSDDTTKRLKELDVSWRDIFGLSAEMVANLIAKDEIDILIDLSGHSAGNRLDVCALKPAPIQVTWLGYPHSTGLAQIDYYFSDSICDPPGMTDHLFSEHVWRLPRVFSCYLPPMEFPTVAPASFKTRGYITFGCFNNLAKLTEGVVDLWAEILNCVPDSRLYLKSMAFAEGCSTWNTLRERFARHGIDSDRIIMNPFATDLCKHLLQYNQVDIALDTYPYHGTTTTCEALWMGVPVVTLAGSTHLSRVGASLLTSIGLAGLVADTMGSYVNIAVTLANDPKRLLQLREDLRFMMSTSPLMDSSGVTREVEAAYKSMYTTAGLSGWSSS